MKKDDQLTQENFKKSLLYKMLHRGCKEMDILCERAKDIIENFSFEELVLFSAFMEEDDYYLLQWISHTELLPVHYQQSAILAFCKKALSFT